MNNRLIEVESRLAFQEDTIQALNQTVMNQGREIEQLKLALKSLKEEMHSMASSQVADEADETPPPHY